MSKSDLQSADFHERFKYILEALNHSANSFAKLIGVNPSIIVKIAGPQKGKPSADTLERISITIPRINMNWLLSGRGEPLKELGTSSTMQVGNTGNVIATMHEGVANYNTSGAGLSDLEQCRGRVRELESIVADKQLIIDLLQNRS